MNNLEVNRKKIKKIIGAIALSTTLGVNALTLDGCATKVTDDKITYTVEDGNSYPDEVVYEFSPLYQTFTKHKTDAVYENYVDLRSLPENLYLADISGEMLSLSEEELDKSNYKLDFVYPASELYLTSSIGTDNVDSRYKVVTDAAFICEHEFVLPDCYAWAKKYFGTKFNDNISDMSYSMVELHGINGNYYLNYNYHIDFDKDIEHPFLNEVPGQPMFDKYGKQRDIKKGDSLDYSALYIYVQSNDNQENNFKWVKIADKQTGMGSDSSNVVDTILGNYDDIYKSIASLNREDESKKFKSTRDFYDYIFHGSEKTLIKR